MPETRFEVDVDGGRLSVLHMPRPKAPRLLLAHANGFNATSYRQFLSPLASHFEIIAPDTRGHGLSQIPLDPKALRDWHIFAMDLATLASRLEPRPTFFVGHSMGAICGLLSAAFHGFDLQGLAMIEPVFMPSWFYTVPHLPGGAWAYQFNPMSNAARSRREYWDNRDQVYARYKDKRLFAHWAEGALADYLETGLIDEDTGVRLACHPDWEAAIFASHAHNPWAALRALPYEVPVLKSARKGSTVYPVWRLKRHRVKLDETTAGHLAPMEDPIACANWVMDQFASRA